ncbi:DinB family protein [Streptomyces sp. NPDC004044]
MSTTTDHLIEAGGGVSLAASDGSAQGADVRTTTGAKPSVNGLSLPLLDELTMLATERVRSGEGLKLMGEGGLLPELAQHLMQAALEAEMEEHLAAEAGQAGGRGSRSGGNMRNGYRNYRVGWHFGGQDVDSQTFAYAGTADEALKQLDEMYWRWNAGVRELSDADLENPPTVGPERFPMEGIVLHVNRELIHHGAEISLLRDLYRWQDGAVPRRI